MADVDFRILGTLEAVRDGERLPLGGAKQRTVLALLLLAANRVVTNDALIEALWPERPPGKPLTAIQGYVSSLRKVLAPDCPFDVIVTEPVGYRLVAEREGIDLHRLESLLHTGREALATGDAEAAQAALREALSLFRGDPLADFAYEDWASPEIGRIEELRLACLEERIEADLALGGHGEVVGELEALIAAHPLRERLRGQLMLALYRSGRQSEALAAYQAARETLVEEFGIDPSPTLSELEKAILTQDASLELAPDSMRPPSGAVQGPERSILVVPGEDDTDRLVSLAEPLARSIVPHELIVARLIDIADRRSSELLAGASSTLNELRDQLVGRGVPVRVATFTSTSIGEDASRLASEQEVDLLVLGRTSDALAESSLDPTLLHVLAEAPCDVAVCAIGYEADGFSDGASVGIPFGGGAHDWAALELGAWIASANGIGLRLLGVADAPELGERDASRLLASAGLAVQQLVGVPTEPVLLPRGEEGLIEASRHVSVLVMGFPTDWSERGLGWVRAGLARRGAVATIFVRRGVRPGGLAPPEGQTRFTWSLSDASAVAPS